MSKIIDVWLRLGGPEPRGKRAPAWWRESKDFNISLDGERWYDFARSVGGGPSELVQHVLNVDSQRAFRWLVLHGFAEQREHRRIPRQTAEDFERGVLAEINELLDRWKRLASTVDLESDEARVIAHHIGTLTRLDRQIRNSPWPVYHGALHDCPTELRRWIRKGRQDRQHAETLAIASIRMLELAEGKVGDDGQNTSRS